MENQANRKWDQNNAHIWNQGIDNNIPPPLPPPPPPPPQPHLSPGPASLPFLPPPPLPPTSSSSHHAPEWDDSRFKQWDQSSTTISDESHYKSWVKRERNKDFGNSVSERQRHLLARRHDSRDGVYAPLPVIQQVYTVTHFQENHKGDKKFWTNLTDDATGRPPPTPPRLDFPVEARTSGRENRRVDEHQTKPRLRAELYPLEEEMAWKKVSRNKRQGPDTIEILPERNSKQQDISDLNLVPLQRIADNTRAEENQDFSRNNKGLSGTKVLNPDRNPNEYEHTLERRSSENEQKEETIRKIPGDERLENLQTLHSKEYGIPRSRVDVLHKYNTQSVDKNTYPEQASDRYNNRDAADGKRKPKGVAVDFKNIADSRRRSGEADFQHGLHSTRYIHGSDREQIQNTQDGTKTIGGSADKNPEENMTHSKLAYREEADPRINKHEKNFAIDQRLSGRTEATGVPIEVRDEFHQPDYDDFDDVRRNKRNSLEFNTWNSRTRPAAYGPEERLSGKIFNTQGQGRFLGKRTDPEILREPQMRERIHQPEVEIRHQDRRSDLNKRESQMRERIHVPEEMEVRYMDRRESQMRERNHVPEEMSVRHMDRRESQMRERNHVPEEMEVRYMDRRESQMRERNHVPEEMSVRHMDRRESQMRERNHVPEEMSVRHMDRRESQMRERIYVPGEMEVRHMDRRESQMRERIHEPQSKELMNSDRRSEVTVGLGEQQTSKTRKYLDNKNQIDDLQGQPNNIRVIDREEPDTYRQPKLRPVDGITSTEQILNQSEHNMGRDLDSDNREYLDRHSARGQRRTISGTDDLHEKFESEEMNERQPLLERKPIQNTIMGSADNIYDKSPRFDARLPYKDPFQNEKQRWKSRNTGRSPSAPINDSLRKRGEGRGPAEMKRAWSAPYEILKEEAEDIPIGKRDSIQLPVLEESEKEFHELVAAGDVSHVRLFLTANPGFNINCVNYQKISALHVAVHDQNEAMVEFLLEQQSLDCLDCALYAIKEGNVRIVEKIMDKIRETTPNLEYSPTSHSVDFPDDMTPIILAAQLGNYEIINFLIKRDHIIPPVHNPYCKCEACKADLQKYDRLKYSTMKLNLYKAICNPMYIFHVTDDPFQRAFDLTQELQDAAKVFPQFKSSYEELWRDLRNFTVDLIGCCRNAQEVEIILKKSANNIAGSITFPRLQYAIDLKQKEFVSHPFTQAVLVDAWTGDLLEWKVRSPLMQALSVLPRIPMLPIMAVMCMFLPNHKLVKKWKTPVNKMISSVASYLIFLIILFLESNLDKKNQKRGPPNSGLEGLIVIYVIGYVWLNIRLCFRLGPKRFFSTMWHWFDCIMLFLFTLTIIFWIASLADITANDEIDLPRKYWNSLDPELIAEGFFAAAVIMAFFRLNMFLSLNYHLGPLQVSIGKMTLDIFRFIIIFFVIILAWCAGLCKFYQPYDGMVQKDSTSGSSTTQVSSFVSFSMTLKTFFWAIFGMSPIESADVVIENLPGDTPDTTIINHHEFTEAVGYIAFALFQFLSVVVVLNMLVACMANTFTKVIDNVTVEWVFGRSQIYLSFMAASTLPPPFNLLPTAAGLKNTLFWLKLLAKPSDGQRAKCNITHCCYIESETEAYVNSEFPSLMSELAQRYLRLKGEDVETHDDLEELKCEMKELLRKMDKIITIRKNS